MNSIRFTNLAEIDLATIHDYTVAQFGITQWNTYVSGLRNAFETIRKNPAIGADRSTIRPALRRLIYKQHAIYYRYQDNTILIFRILHLRQDPGRHL